MSGHGKPPSSAGTIAVCGGADEGAGFACETVGDRSEAGAWGGVAVGSTSRDPSGAADVVVEGCRVRDAAVSARAGVAVVGAAGTGEGNTIGAGAAVSITRGRATTGASGSTGPCARLSGEGVAPGGNLKSSTCCAATGVAAARARAGRLEKIRRMIETGPAGANRSGERCRASVLPCAVHRGQWHGHDRHSPISSALRRRCPPRPRRPSSITCPIRARASSIWSVSPRRNSPRYAR